MQWLVCHPLQTWVHTLYSSKHLIRPPHLLWVRQISQPESDLVDGIPLEITFLWSAFVKNNRSCSQARNCWPLYLLNSHPNFTYYFCLFCPVPQVWSTSTCEFVRTLNGHKRGIACLQYRDRLVVSGSSDNTIRWFSRLKEFVILIKYTSTLLNTQDLKKLTIMKRDLFLHWDFDYTTVLTIPNSWTPFNIQGSRAQLCLWASLRIIIYCVTVRLRVYHTAWF